MEYSLIDISTSVPIRLFFHLPTKHGVENMLASNDFVTLSMNPIAFAIDKITLTDLDIFKVRWSRDWNK